MNKGFIKELFLEIGALFILILTTVGVIQTKEVLPIQPPALVIEERPMSETPDATSETSSEENNKSNEEPETPKESQTSPKDNIEKESPVSPPPVTIDNQNNVINTPEPTDDLSGQLTGLNTNELTRKSVVNVFCVSNDSRVNSITGSGIIIDPRGIVLTNAHIAQHFLLNNLTNCTLRTGSPAENTYKAELLYISPTWVKENYVQISEQNPRGTGENDFALLRITGRTNEQVSLPSTFPFVNLNLKSNQPEKNSDVLIVGYPAGFLGGTIIQNSLSIVSATGKVADVFTFGNSDLDLFSVLGSIIAQKGASGGAVVDSGGKLIGIVVTASQEEITGLRELRAITISHIERSLISELGVSISSFLLGNIDGKVEQFNSLIAPSLKTLLLQAI